MAEERDGINGAVVRGWLSRMSPGPWAGVADSGGDDTVHVFADDGEIVAVVETAGPHERPHENAGPITQLPAVLRRYLTASGELIAIEHALRGAGIDEGGVAGIEALLDRLGNMAAEVAEARREYDAQAAGWDETIDRLHEEDARLSAVRGHIMVWGGTPLDDAEAGALYRWLTSALMATTPPNNERGDDGSND